MLSYGALGGRDAVGKQRFANRKRDVSRIAYFDMSICISDMGSSGFASPFVEIADLKRGESVKKNGLHMEHKDVSQISNPQPNLILNLLRIYFYLFRAITNFSCHCFENIFCIILSHLFPSLVKNIKFRKLDII